MTPVPNPSETPQELLGIESALDRLARADAGSMPSDLPGRIASSTWAARAVVVRPDVAARIGGRSVSGWRAAASLMILLGGATFAGWLATRSSVGARGASVASADATLASDVWSAVDAAWSDDAWARTTSALQEADALRVSIDAIGRDGWSVSEIVDTDWLQDSM